jgi:hypothetical protein
MRRESMVAEGKDEKENRLGSVVDIYRDSVPVMPYVCKQLYYATRSVDYLGDIKLCSNLSSSFTSKFGQ